MQTHEWDQFKSELKKQLRLLPTSPRKNIHDDITAATASHIKEGRVVQSSLTEISGKLIDDRDHFIPRQVCAITMANFLWSYESDYVLIIDEISSLLVINGHDIYNVFKREFASSYSDVTEIDMDTKIRFLKAHNFGLLDRPNDKRLRNKLAHRDFTLKEDGRLIIGNLDIFIMDNLTNLLNFITDVNNMVATCYNEVTDEIQNSKVGKNK